jgi:hypothetical protein
MKRMRNLRSTFRKSCNCARGRERSRILHGRRPDRLALEPTFRAFRGGPELVSVTARRICRGPRRARRHPAQRLRELGLDKVSRWPPSETRNLDAAVFHGSFYAYWRCSARFFGNGESEDEPISTGMPCIYRSRAAAGARRIHPLSEDSDRAAEMRARSLAILFRPFNKLDRLFAVRRKYGLPAANSPSGSLRAPATRPEDCLQPTEDSTSRAWLAWACLGTVKKKVAPLPGSDSSQIRLHTAQPLGIGEQIVNERCHLAPSFP